MYWNGIFARLKEMEPFYQLAKPGGSKAADSLLLGYTETYLFKVLSSSVSRKQWLVVIGSVNMVLTTICILFAEETLFLSPYGDDCTDEIDPTATRNKNCHVRLTTNRAVAWSVCAVLAIIFVSSAAMVFLVRRRPSGIFAEASSIAGTLSLYRHSVTEQLSLVSSTASTRFALSASEVPHNSIISLGQPPRHNTNHRKAARKQETSEQILVHPVSMFLNWIFLGAVLTTVVYYRVVSKPGAGNGFETFMDNPNFGARFFMTGMGLAIKSFWAAVESHVRCKVPYILLASRDGATADESVLVSSPSNPISGLFSRSTWKSYFLGPASLMAFLSEILVVTLAAVPFSTERAYEDFEACVSICIIILGMMILTVPVMLAWKLTKDVGTPKLPECIADLFAMVDPDLALKFASLGNLDEKDRNCAIRSWNLCYRMQKMQYGPDNQGPEWKLTASHPAN